MSAQPGQRDIREGGSTSAWYCPLCGYVDPGTRNTHCPQRHPEGRHPLFREAHYGYYIRIGLEERDDAS